MPIYMKIDTIDGDVTHERFRNWHEVFSFSWAEANPAAGFVGGAGSGKVQMQDFSVVKRSTKGSPKIMLVCANGSRLPAVQIEVTFAHGEAEQPYQRYTLSDCAIASYQVGGDAASVPTENVAFNFAKIKFEQWVYRDDGGSVIETAWWDRRLNKGG